MAELRLPMGYVPYNELNLCSNVLVNVPVPISVRDQPVLLVGQSSSLIPQVWLAAPDGPDSKEWVFVVERNRALRPLITIQITSPGPIFPGHSIHVIVGSTIVLRAKHVSTEAAIVDALDLRPLGLVVYGSATELRVGGMTMERNRLANLRVAFAIGVEDQRQAGA